MCCRIRASFKRLVPKLRELASLWGTTAANSLKATSLAVDLDEPGKTPQLARKRPSILEDACAGGVS